MSFNWTEYVYVAQELAQQPQAQTPTNDAKLRAAISRAYYAAFCNARKYLDNKHISYNTTGMGTHNSVIDKFKRDQNPNKKNIGLLLNNLKKTRKLVDYKDDDITDLSNKTEKAIKKAERVISSLSLLP